MSDVVLQLLNVESAYGPIRAIRGARLSAGSRTRVMPCATIAASHRIGAPAATWPW